MDATSLIRRLFEHLRWTNHRLLAACESLSAGQLTQPFQIGQGTILATLTHLYAAEFVWLAAIEGDPNPVSPFEMCFDSFADLCAAWKSLESRWDRFLATLTESELDRPVLKKSTSSFAGKVHPIRLGDVLLHITTHAQYTSAQLKNMLRGAGVSPLPDIMLITLGRQQAADASP